MNTAEMLRLEQRLGRARETYERALQSGNQRWASRAANLVTGREARCNAFAMSHITHYR